MCFFSPSPRSNSVHNDIHDPTAESGFNFLPLPRDDAPSAPRGWKYLDVDFHRRATRYTRTIIIIIWWARALYYARLHLTRANFSNKVPAVTLIYPRANVYYNIMLPGAVAKSDGGVSGARAKSPGARIWRKIVLAAARRERVNRAVNTPQRPPPPPQLDRCGDEWHVERAVFPLELSTACCIIIINNYNNTI